MPTTRPDHTHLSPERTPEVQQAIDRLSYCLWWMVRRRLEWEAQQAQQVQQGHPDATTAPEQAHDPS